MKRRQLLFGLLCAVLLAAGCASSGKDDKSAALGSSAGSPGAESEPIGDLHLSEFILGVGDEIKISVYRHDALDQTIAITLSGKIMFPLVGDIQAAGKSVFALRDEITEKLSRYLVKPVVTVQVSVIRSRRTMVLGEVKSPGSFVLDMEVTVLEALSKAGGATADANLNQVLLVRNAPGNKKVELYLDLKKALDDQDYTSNVVLQNGDILYVPLKGIANIGRYATYLSNILSPLVQLEGGIVLWPLVKDVISGTKSSTQITIPTAK